LDGTRSEIKTPGYNINWFVFTNDAAFGLVFADSASGGGNASAGWAESSDTGADFGCGAKTAYHKVMPLVLTTCTANGSVVPYGKETTTSTLSSASPMIHTSVCLTAGPSLSTEVYWTSGPCSSRAQGRSRLRARS
jgi:hypothetical protein